MASVGISEEARNKIRVINYTIIGTSILFLLLVIFILYTIFT